MKSAYAQKSESSQSVTTHDASCVDDRRTLPVAQRVLERESGVVQREGEVVLKEGDPAYKKFKYLPPAVDALEGFGPEAGFIAFCKYSSVECRSHSFTGCLMMAFHFNDKNSKKENVDQTTSLDALIFGGLSNVLVGENEKYVAHVFMSSEVNVETGKMWKDTSEALYDAKNRGLITIEALFKPLIDSDAKNIRDASEEAKKTDVAKSILIGKAKFTGGLTFDKTRKWSASVYVPDEPASVCGVYVYDGLKGGYSEKEINDDFRRLKSFDSHELDRQTKATMAFVYASAGDYVKMRKKLSHETKKDDGLFELFLKICSLRVLEQVRENVPEMESAITAEITSRKKEEEKVDRMSPPENPGCCIIS